MNTIAKLVAELKGTQCRCGKRKRARQTFCSDCYYRLPRNLRGALYQLVGQGYEAAYQAAVDYLEGKPS